MASISGVATTGRRGATATISGSGFGASQGSSVLIFWPVYGAAVTVTPTSWGATQIVADIPTNGDDTDLGKNAFFAVTVSGDPIPARTSSFVLLAEAIPTPTVYPWLTYVFAPPGTEAAGTVSAAASLSGAAAVSATLTMEGAYEDVYAMMLDGGNDYVDFGNVHAFAETDPFTFSLWFKRPSFTTGRRAMVSKLCNGTNPRGYSLALDDSGAIEWNLQSDTSDYIRFTSDTPVADDGEWHHLAVTYDGSMSSAGMDVYLDDSPVVGTRTGTLIGPIADTCPMYLGGKAVGGITEPWLGMLDDVAVLNKRLSALEVTEAYNAGMTMDLRAASFSANLRSFWLMGDGDTYPTIIDWGPAAHNGTMMNTSGAAFRLDTPAVPTISLLAAMSGAAAVTGTLSDVVGDFSTRSIRFNDGTDYVNTNLTAFSPERTTPFSVSLWVITLETGGLFGNVQSFLSKRAASGNYQGFQLGLMNVSGTGRFAMSLFGAGGEVNSAAVIRTNTAYNDGEWHHVVFINDGTGNASGLSIYVDGVLAPTTVYTNLLGVLTIINTEPVLMNAGGAWNLDDVSIHEKVLTAPEVTAFYNSGLPTDLTPYEVSSSMVDWWWMGDGDTYPTIIDHGSNASDATMVNMTSGNISTNVPDPTQMHMYSVLQGTAALQGTLDKVLENNYSTEFNPAGTDYIECNRIDAPSIEYNQAVTISFWCKFTANDALRWIMYKEAADATLRGFRITAHVGTTYPEIRFCISHDASIAVDTIARRTTDSGITLNEWHQVTCTYDGGGLPSGIHIFVDGFEPAYVEQGVSITATCLNTEPFYMGYAGAGANPAGKIDEVVFFYYDMSATSWYVVDWYNGGTPMSPLSWAYGVDYYYWYRMGDGDTHPTIINWGAQVGCDLTMVNMSGANFVADVPAKVFNVNSLALDASGACANMGNNVAFERNTPFTISCWFKCTDSSLVRTLVAKVANAGGDNGYVLYVYDENITFVLGNTVPTDCISVYTTTGAATDGEWHHVVATYEGFSDANSITIYVDGVLQTKTVAFNNLVSTILSTNPFEIGFATTSGAFLGNIDEVAIYDDTFNVGFPAGIYQRELYNNGTPKDPRACSSADLPAGGLIHYWRLGDLNDAGATTYDQVGSVDGTLTGTAAFAADVP